jgi:two-component system CheB/CheR fusion protein
MTDTHLETADAEQVLRTLVPMEREDGRWFLMRLGPYRTREDHIEGVVITFIDIHGRKAATKPGRGTRVIIDIPDEYWK